MAALPAFRYHLDPVGSGVLVASDARCLCCRETPGVLYTGPVFFAGDEELLDRLCPWCIADGSASERFDAEFVPIDGEVATIPDEAQNELGKRTVSFTGWQEVEWLAHCGDAMAFVAMADGEVVRAHHDALSSLRQQFGSWDHSQFDEFLGALSTDGSPTAYLFRCLHCGAHRANADFD